METQRCPYRIDPTGEDIAGEATHLRSTGMCPEVVLVGDIPARMVTDHQLIKRLLTDPRVSKDPNHWPLYREGKLPSDWPLIPFIDNNSAFSAYGSDHTRLRQVVVPELRGPSVRKFLPTLEGITNALLDQLEQVPEGEVDLKRTFTWKLPLMVLQHLLGVPEDMQQALGEGVDSLFATDDAPVGGQSSGAQFAALLSQLVMRKRGAPGDDVTTRLIGAHKKGILTEDELLGSLLLLIAAGHEATVHLLDQMIVNLLTHRQQLIEVIEGRATWDDAIEETLRFQPPTANVLLRYAMEDIEEAGVVIREGEALVISLAAVGRDWDVHGVDADRFDITRPTRRRHLSFGYGSHLCPGAELARWQARIAVPALLDRFPEISLATPKSLDPIPSFIANGFTRVPVILRSRAAVVSGQ
ncbi:cytochrome P450 [Streptomyces sp. FXJ1.4098]|nr:cytochrome P450 [Streptomyces sp. FXJ1.4098]